MTELLEEARDIVSSALARDIVVHPRGPSEVQLQVPFYFADGDGFVIYVRRSAEGYELTDKAHTLQHLSYHVDTSRLRVGQRASVFEQVLRRFSVQDLDGELVRSARNEAELGDAVFAYVQALTEITDLRHLERDIVKSAFQDDLRTLVVDAFPGAVRQYVDPHHDPERKYPVDYLLNGVSRPIAVFGVPTDEAAVSALLISKKFAEWGRTMRFVAIEEDQSKLSRRSVAWLSDNFDKQYSSLEGNRDAITGYLARELDTSRRLDQLRG